MVDWNKKIALFQTKTLMTLVKIIISVYYSIESDMDLIKIKYLIISNLSTFSYDEPVLQDATQNQRI